MPRRARRARRCRALAGLPDDAFEHDGQLTKREIRAATLARAGAAARRDAVGCRRRLRLDRDRMAARRSRAAPAIAIERDPARAAMIARNAAALGVPGLRIVVGDAPAALAGLPPPDAVFIGGGIADRESAAGAMAALRPGGRLVANVVSLEGERALLDWQARHGGELTRIAVSRAEPLGAHRAWRPLLAVDPARRDKAAADMRGGSTVWLAGWRPYALLARAVPAALSAGHRRDPAARPRRGALRPGDAADAGDRRFPAHPLPGRGAQQEAGRHLLAAGRLGRRVQHAGEHRDLALSPAVADRRRRAAVLLTFAFGDALLAALPGDAGAALLAAVLLGSVARLVAEAHIAKTDAALLAAIVAGQGALGLAYVARRAGRPVGCGIAARVLARRNRGDPAEGAGRPGAGAR